MEMKGQNIEIPPDGLKTASGLLYSPQPTVKQVIVVVAVFAGSIGMGWLMGRVPGNLPQNAQEAMFVPYMLIFFFGYALWGVRIKTIVFKDLGFGLLKALFSFLIFKRKPKHIQDILPDKEKLMAMLVKCQKAAGSITYVGWIVGGLTSAVSWLLNTGPDPLMFSFFIGFTCVLWGYFVGRLGRRGWLLMAADEE